MGIKPLSTGPYILSLISYQMSESETEETMIKLMGDNRYRENLVERSWGEVGEIDLEYTF